MALPAILVGCCGARAALSIECLPTLQYLIPCNKSSSAFRTNLMISSLATNLLLNFLECRHRLPRTVQNGQDSNLCRGGGNILKYCNLLKPSPLNLQNSIHPSEIFRGHESLEQLSASPSQNYTHLNASCGPGFLDKAAVAT